MRKFLGKGYFLLPLALCIMSDISKVMASKSSTSLEVGGSSRQQPCSNWDGLYHKIMVSPGEISHDSALQAAVIDYYFQGFPLVKPTVIAALIPDLKKKARLDAKALWLLIQSEISTSGDVSLETKCMIESFEGKEDSDAYIVLGKCYCHGWGGTRNHTKGFNYIQSAAKLGNAVAQCIIGDAFFIDHTKEDNEIRACQWFNKAAKQGNAVAQFRLGEAYRKGEGVSKDLLRAIELYEQAAEQGHAEAQFKVGTALFYGQGVPQNQAQACQWFYKAAMQDDERAQCNLGEIYFFGHGVPQDYGKAGEWYRKAAEQGNLKGITRYAEIFLYGYGVEKDEAKAVQLLHMAAKRNYAEAYYHLGLYMRRDLTDEASVENALYFLQEAARQEYVPAQTALGEMYSNILNDQDQAFTWYFKAAMQGDRKAQSALGNLYSRGYGVVQDQAQSLFWFRKAAEQGDAAAQYNLGEAYFYGNGVPQNYAQAILGYRKAADQGYAPAQFTLGFAYFHGIKVKKNRSRAVEWYRKAAEQGDAAAQTSLAEAYYKGHGIEKDEVKAIEWYRKAAEQGDVAAQLMLGVAYFKDIGGKKDHKGAFWYSLLAKQASLDFGILSQLKNMYTPVLHRNASSDAKNDYFLGKSPLNALARLSSRLAELKHYSPGTEGKDQEMITPLMLPSSQQTRVSKIYNNLSEIQKTLETALPLALSKPGFMITNLTFGCEPAGPDTGSPYMQYFNVRGEEYLCLGQNNINFAHSIFKLFADTEVLINTTVGSIRSGLKVLDDLANLKIAGKQEQDLKANERRAFYHQTVAMLEELKASVKEAKDFTEEEIAAAVPRSNEIFVKEFDACFD